MVCFEVTSEPIWVFVPKGGAATLLARAGGCLPLFWKCSASFCCGNTATWGTYPAICVIPSEARVKGQSPCCCDGCWSRRGMLKSGGWAAGFGGGESSSLVN